MCQQAVIGVRSTFQGQKQTVGHQSLATWGGIGQEDANLAVVNLAEVAIPLPLHATGSTAFLGDGRGVQDQDSPGIAQFVADVLAQFVEDGVVTPQAGADKLLQGPSFLVCLACDGLGGFAFQTGEFAAQDGVGVFPQLLAVEKGR